MSGSQLERASSANSTIDTDGGSLTIIAQIFGDTCAKAGFFFEATLDDAIRCNGDPIVIRIGAKRVE